MLRRRGTVGVVPAVLLAAALALLAAWAHASGEPGPAGGNLVVASAQGGAEAGGDGHGLSVSGSVSGLFPGVRRDLVVTVKNEMSFPIRVTTLSATIADASTTCKAANLSVGSFRGSRRVPAKGSATVTLTLAMSHDAGDACQRAHFPLHYSATATRASEPAGPSATPCAVEGDESCE